MVVVFTNKSYTLFVEREKITGIRFETYGHVMGSYIVQIFTSDRYSLLNISVSCISEFDREKIIRKILIDEYKDNSIINIEKILKGDNG